MSLTYVLPIKSVTPHVRGDFADYVPWIGARAETIVVDGSDPAVFAAHAAAWGNVVRHVQPAPDLLTPMGKVGGVLTGVRLASHETIIIADDDVRYDEESLARVARGLVDADVVRPQNYFAPLPWHALWDSGRTLLNRASGGDWPGTLGVRRAALDRTGGYDGRAMFENLELVRTVVAAGGREVVLLDAWSLIAAGGILVAIAEAGRRRSGGSKVFPRAASFAAPAWTAERAVCSWLAVALRLAYGGVPYRGTILHHAATSMKLLRVRHGNSFTTLTTRPAALKRSRIRSA